METDEQVPGSEELLRPDRELRAVVEFAGDFDRIAGKHELRRLKEYLLLRGPDLRLDDVDGDFLFPQQAGDSVPDGCGAFAGIHRRAGG
jgi:hypothetical protein